MFPAAPPQSRQACRPAGKFVGMVAHRNLHPVCQHRRRGNRESLGRKRVGVKTVCENEKKSAYILFISMCASVCVGACSTLHPCFPNPWILIWRPLLPHFVIRSGPSDLDQTALVSYS